VGANVGSKRTAARAARPNTAMRNIFDQYDQPENRLTHALATCLHEDRRLLRSFVRWATGEKPPVQHHLQIVEQTLPGESDLTEEEAETRGLPDAWIHDDEVWALIIECKVKSAIDLGQLRRHRATAIRRGFERPGILVLSPEKPPKQSLAGWSHRTWPEVYAWFMKQSSRSAWARRMVEYMEVAEARLPAEGYLERGSLTMFSGIRFDSNNPYNYAEAKRLLRLALQELRRDKRLQRLGMDPKGKGRPAITGREGASVWDFLPLRRAARAAAFTACPHLTLSIQSQRVLVVVTIPHGIKTEFRRNLLALERDGFRHLLMEVEGRLRSVLRTADGAKPWMEVVQRHYRTQRSAATVDALLEFDLRTALPRETKKRGDDVMVKTQPQWLDSAYRALANKHSNLQIVIGAMFPHGCRALRSRTALDYIARTWLACEPFLKVVLGRRFIPG